MDRQEIIATNKSLRLIKNELEHLLEKGVLTDDIFDTITRQLPSESPLSGAPTPAVRNAAASVPTPTPTPPVNSMANLALNQNPSPTAAPPAYNTTGPPSLPNRGGPTPAPPSKPVIARAKALYKYQAADDRDLSFERDDPVEVHEYMNDDWWMGRNARTGAEGIFPKNYVEVDRSAGPNGFANEKQGFYAPPQPTYAQGGPGAGQGFPPPPGPSNPYNANAPPVAMANQQQQGGGEGSGKAGEYGKKFGKKLGNAAIFGAGATLGGKIVNGIF